MPEQQVRKVGGRGDARHAIAAKRLQAEANRQRISAALLRLQQSGLSVNVQSVARAAEVSADTVRRNPDLYQEVRRLRDQQGGSGMPPPSPSGQVTALAQSRAQLADAREEIADLRRELAVARAAAHQALGTGADLLTPEEAADLRREHAELTVALQESRQEVARLRDERNDLVDELTAAHDLNRDFTRRLTAVEEDAQRARADAGLARVAALPTEPARD